MMKYEKKSLNSKLAGKKKHKKGTAKLNDIICYVPSFYTICLTRDAFSLVSYKLSQHSDWLKILATLGMFLEVSRMF